MNWPKLTDIKLKIIHRSIRDCVWPGTAISTHLDAISYSVLNIDMYNNIQKKFAEIWALKNCNLCVNLWVSQKANASFFIPYIH